MLGLSESLRSLVVNKFIQARADKDLIFSETQLTILRTPFQPAIQLRYCPALGQKPTKDRANNKKADSTKKFDPFEDPPFELMIAAIPVTNPTHNLVLNKYPVIANHFILATRANKAQTDLLEEEDLYLTFACLQSWQDTDEEDSHSLFAFFNSGDHSGASQAHRHLQFLSIEDMKEDQQEDWEILCTSMTVSAHNSLPLLHNPSLPFIHFAVKVHEATTASELHQKYVLLLRAAVASISDNEGLESLNAVRVDQDGRSIFSYNLAMTSDMMVILPRRNGDSLIPSISNGSVSINGTILAGTMMVKAEEEWTCLRQRPELVQQILENIAFPSQKRASMGKQNL